ncbi:MAG TPA: formyltransferase family protein [Polyangiaceae bacterium]|nr:formyltransferase family protein [Polyangiaceae bacterium]
MARLRVAFVGLPLAALLLAADGHDVVYAGICRKGALGTRRLRATLGRGRVFVKPNLDAHAERVRALEPDLVVSWFWTSKVPPAFRQAARLAAFGVHPSLLPRHRGGDPYFAAIDLGDAVTGVTAHLLEDAYDTGHILGRRELALDPSWSAWRLAKRLDRPSLGLLREVARAYAEGRPPTPEPQDEALATEAGLLAEEDLELDLSMTAERLARRVRAASPYPGAYLFVGEALLTVVRAEATAAAPRGLRPGEITVDADGFAIVKTRDGGLRLLAARLADDDDDEPARERELDRREIAELVRALARGGEEDGSLAPRPYVD